MFSVINSERSGYICVRPSRIPQRLLPGPRGLANNFWPSLFICVLCIPSSLLEMVSDSPNSAIRKSSLISAGSEVSILREAIWISPDDEARIIVFVARKTERTLDEYTILNFTGAFAGQE